MAVAHREASDAASPNAGSSNELFVDQLNRRLARDFERYAGGAQADAKISEEAGRAETVDELGERAAELVRVNVDVIFATSLRYS